jgi:O-succinylbenzoic acid--CoA ligase
LQSLGVQAGDRVALLMGNSAGFVLATHAVLQLGAVLVPISTREAAPGVDFILNQCGATAVITDSQWAHLLPTARKDGAALLTWLLPTHLHSLESLLPLPAAAQPHEDDAAVILYTSGTTGQPKGAVLTHLNLIHSVLHYQHGLGLHAQDRALLAVPGSHVTGLVAIILAMAGVGGCVVVLREFKAAACVQQVVAHRVSYSLMVPAMYALCLREPGLAQADLSAWRWAGFGGAPMPPSTIEGLGQHCPGLRLFNAYGATETTSPATMTPPPSTRVDKVGVPVHCADIRVMDANGVEVPTGTPGEVWIAGPMVVPRYWNNPQATEQGFVAGYWKSGDIGTLDEDGYLQVHDRQKDMINRGGYKVFSVEVENCLVGHSEVLEAATVGVPCPVLGERTHAFVVAPNCSDTSALQAALKARCQSELADYKTPDAWTFLTEPLPRNANGKVLKRQLRERALG